MSITLAFDIYGTLINTSGVVGVLQSFIGSDANDFSDTWRAKQLEYSFRRGLMQNYVTFAEVTRQALDYTCALHQQSLSDLQKQELLNSYRILPAFDDVKDGLSNLKARDFRLFAFSNGTAEAIETLLQAANIREYFSDVISVDDIKSFKPNPATYAHFLRKSKATGHRAWLISSNGFDVIGAISIGMKAAWVQRSDDVIFDPWGIEPTVTISSLIDLGEKISSVEI